MSRSAMLLGAVVVGAALLAPPEVAGEFGLAPAEAASQAGRGAARGKRATGVRHASTAGRQGRRVRFTEKKGFAVKARYASLPKFKPRLVMHPAAISPAPKATPAQAAAPAPRPDPGTAESDLASLPPDRVIATASITPAPVVDPNAERMRPALEARARSMASELGLVALPPPDAAPPVQLAARSVTFDLQKGVRTIVFDDGATVTAPFDKERAAGLTGLKPASP